MRPASRPETARALSQRGPGRVPPGASWLFVSTGGFTKDAEDEARSQEIRRVTLVDLKRLFDLWVEHYDKIAESARRLLPLKPIYYLLPEE
jgi:hypothetical protein